VLVSLSLPPSQSRAYVSILALGPPGELTLVFWQLPTPSDPKTLVSPLPNLGGAYHLSNLSSHCLRDDATEGVETIICEECLLLSSSRPHVTRKCVRLCHTPSLFCLSYFPVRVSHFLPGLASDPDPPTYASCKTEITGMGHHYWLVS
jgi:hypothetical protein